MSIWGLPLITALVAGDIVASESHNGTLKTILTRSRERGQIFAAKVLASFSYVIAVVFAMGLVGVRRGQPRVRVPSADLALGHEGLRLARARPARREPRRLRAAARRRRGVRADALDRDPQQRRLGRGDADVRAADAAARGAARDRELPALPPRHAVRRLARLPPRAGRLRAGHARRAGSARSTPSCRSSRRTSSSCAGTSQGTNLCACRRATQRGRPRRRQSAGSRRSSGASATRSRSPASAVYGSTEAQPERHFLGWVGRGRPRRAVRLGRGMGHHGCPRARSVVGTDASVFPFRYN